MRAYVRWATEHARLLRQYVEHQNVERLVLTKAFYSLLDNSTGSSPRGFPLLGGELEARLADLDRESKELSHAIDRWGSGPPLVVLDTNAYLHAANQFTELDLGGLVGDEWHLLVPMVVVDELDRHKRSRQTPTDHQERLSTRARQALVLIERHLGSVGEPRPLDETPHLIEILPDPPGNRRLPIADDEIVQCAADVQAVAGRTVHIVTNDTGMLVRARAAGLDAHRLEGTSLAIPSPSRT
jgi:rRNA-processing protein FCF1